MANWWDPLPSPEDFAKGGDAPAREVPKGGNWWDAAMTPAEFAGQSISPSGPLPSDIGDDPARMASVGRQAAASLPTDDLARVKYLATKRFPDLPPPQAMDRYFYKDNRLAYKDTDGKAFYEEPSLRLPTSMANLAQDAKAVASGAGPALPAIGATIATLPSLAEGPAGIGTGVPSAMLGGGAGDVVRQFLANQITGEEKPWLARGLETGKAAASQGLAQLLGNTVAKGVGALKGQTPTFDIPEVSALRDASKKWDIPLTAGEETGNRTLLRRQKVLANTTQGEDTFTKFYEGRNEKVGAAVNTLLNKISPAYPSPRMAAGAGVEGAQAAVTTARKAVQAKAQPFYDEAITAENTVPLDQLTQLPSWGRIESAIKRVQRDPVFKDTLDGLPPNSMPVIDQAKKAIDDMTATAIKAGERNKARLWSEAADDLRTVADANVPAYGKGRAIYEEGMPAVTSVEKGVVGDAAKLENNDVLRAPSIIFGKGSSPEDVRQARAAFVKAGQEDKWDALVRSHLEQTFNNIADSASGSITNIGGAFRKAVYGNQTKRAILDAAVEHNPSFTADINSLMTTLEATGRAMKGESITAFAQAGQKELASEAKGIGPKILETFELWKTPSRIANYWADLQSGAYNSKMATLLTTPEGRVKLRELRQLSPGSNASVVALSRLLTTGGIDAGENYIALPHKDGPAVPKGQQ